jgi:site-specific DNA-adenine methylase
MADDHQKKLLKKLIKSAPYSQAMHAYCIDRISSYMKEPLTPISFNEELAFCTWYVLCTSFNSAMDGGFGYSSSCPIPSGSTNKQTKKLISYKDSMLKFSKKLERVQIFNDDAIVILDRFCKNKDNSKTLVYIDPPYIGNVCGKDIGKNADQGWYSGYTENQYIDLLDWISNFNGMFLISNYPSPVLSDYVMENGWNYYELDLQSSANMKNNKSRKTEAIAWNYKEQKTLFGGL